MFGRGSRWAPYPKRSFADLDPLARRYVTLVARMGGGPSLQYAGLVPPWALARYAGLDPAGPADLPVPLDGRSVPFWILATHVGSGSVEPESALAALAGLDVGALLAAWTEVADGRALDALRCWTVVPKEAEIPLTRRRLAYQGRLFAWMGEVAGRLGAPAREASGGIPDAYAQLLVDLSRRNVGGIDAWWPERLAAWHGALPASTRERVGPLDTPPKARV